MEHYCENCKWFDLSTFEDGFRESWCIRYPPVYVGPPVSEMKRDETPNVMGYWDSPTVGIRHCCGEWAPREDDPQEDTVHFPAWFGGAYPVDCAETPKQMATAEVHDVPSDLYQRNRKLEARNKALLEALGNALAALDYECGNCGYRSECTSPDCIAADRIRSMMRGLGIEVH